MIGNALDGVFYLVAQQERQIRKHPAAQTTSLLKELFGSRFSSGAAR